MSFSNPNSENAPSGNFGQRLGQYMGQHNPLVGALFQQVFGQPQSAGEHQLQGIGSRLGSNPVVTNNPPLPDMSQPQQMADMAQPAKGLNISAIAKLLMGA